jgi:hypothetical protein
MRATRYGFLFGLAPSGVYPATLVTKCAVRSYRTISPLPLSRRYIFCGTFRGLAPPRRYLALCPAEPGLSSTCSASFDALHKQRLPGRLPGPPYRSASVDSRLAFLLGRQNFAIDLILTTTQNAR